MASRMIRPATAFPETSRRTKRIKVESRDHLAFIRSLPCVVTGLTEGVQAAHINDPDLRYGKLGRGKGTKDDDCWTLPLQRTAHEIQHRMGERAYWQHHRIDPCRTALALWRCSLIGDYETALIVLQHARDE